MWVCSSKHLSQGEWAQEHRTITLTDCQEEVHLERQVLCQCDLQPLVAGPAGSAVLSQEVDLHNWRERGEACGGKSRVESGVMDMCGQGGSVE